MCSLPSDAMQTLEVINLKIKRGLLVAVVGRVGSWKSSLLSALQGEIPRVASTFTTRGSTSCVNQTTWIQNAAIGDCILFGLPMYQERFTSLKALAIPNSLRIITGSQFLICTF